MQYGRTLAGFLGRHASRGKARLVVGARQTGKSTLFRMLRSPDDLLIDLQERSERIRLAQDPEALVRSLLPPARRPRRVFIDEIQRVPELLDEIQGILDRHPGRFTFTLTGSSARRLRGRGVNLLPGRIHRFRLSPVCLWEQAAPGAGSVLPAPGRSVGPPFPLRRLEETLVLGNLPGAFVEGEGFKKTLESYAEVYIEEEVMREAAARNLGDYGRFLALAAVESGKPINLTKISQESGVALTTIRGFYAVLEDTLLGFTLPPFSRSGRVRVLKTPKFYFFDVGVRNALARLPLERGILATEGRPLLEHWVACELAARIGYVGRTRRLSYWRTVDGAEVDFVLELPREAIPIEVKYTERPRPEDARGAERFLDRYPGLARRGLVVCRCTRPEKLTRRVRAVPWQSL
ncbi:MAG TPA: ATP-binding protein [Planctomycetota bacterium]|jgi:predicted AAA+ superfamily ATPase|nr:ATP-binding protein [Planctomycetota bacterium]